MTERTQITLKLILSHIILPIGLVVYLFFITNDVYLFCTITQTVFFILYFAGYWEFFGLSFKRLFMASLELALLLIFIYKLLKPTNSHPNLILLLILSVVQAYLLIILVKIFIVIFRKDKVKLEITFPLKNGTYLITDGGNSKISRLMNYHYYSLIHRKNRTNNSMVYATDVVKIARSKGKFLPRRNEDYPIFGEKVYCPMPGEVIKVENNIDNNKPFIGKYPYNTGNTVVIRNGNFYFLLGHLKKGSISVGEGETVQQDDFIGQIGNSGFSERPHLHFQLIKSDSENYWSGKGICIQYQGKNLYKNRIIEVA